MLGLFDLWSGILTLLIDAVGTYAIIFYVDGSLMPWVSVLQRPLQDSVKESPSCPDLWFPLFGANYDASSFSSSSWY